MVVAASAATILTLTAATTVNCLIRGGRDHYPAPGSGPGQGGHETWLILAAGQCPKWYALYLSLRVTLGL